MNSEDLGALLGWCGLSSVADLNNDATTNSFDLGIMLGAWGSCGD